MGRLLRKNSKRISQTIIKIPIVPSVFLYFHAHQPNRLKEYSFFEIGNSHFYENDALNIHCLNEVSNNAYLPANQFFKTLIQDHPEFKFGLSFTGILIEQMEFNRQDVLQSFVDLTQCGNVEFIAETFYNSLAFHYSKTEFDRQIKLHLKKIEQHFGQRPKVFRNTGLIYNNQVAAHLESLGFKGILAPGLPWHLNGLSPHYNYNSPIASTIKTIVSDDAISYDLTFNWTNKNWESYPLTGRAFAEQIVATSGDTVNIYLDYEIFGKRIKDSQRMREFWIEFVESCKTLGISFNNPSDVCQFESKGTYDVHHPISWNFNNDLTAWMGSSMQFEALKKIYELESIVKQSFNKDLIHVWSKLQTSDHFYFMSDLAYQGNKYKTYSSPYESPYDSYIYFMNALADLEISSVVKKISPIDHQSFDHQDLTVVYGIDEHFQQMLRNIGVNNLFKLTQIGEMSIDEMGDDYKAMYFQAIKDDWARSALEILRSH